MYINNKHSREGKFIGQWSVDDGDYFAKYGCVFFKYVRSTSIPSPWLVTYIVECCFQLHFFL